jgi:hypothetical protein
MSGICYWEEDNVRYLILGGRGCQLFVTGRRRRSGICYWEEEDVRYFFTWSRSFVRICWIFSTVENYELLWLGNH